MEISDKNPNLLQILVWRGLKNTMEKPVLLSILHFGVRQYQMDFFLFSLNYGITSEELPLEF